MKSKALTQWKSMKNFRNISVLILTIMVFTLTQPVFASDNNPGVVSPNKEPYGETYNQWTAEWWKYVMSIPASSNPLADPTGAHCNDGQSGPVFFLAGTTGGLSVRDDCVVPAGKYILFPVINVISAVPEDGATAAEIVNLASWYMSHTDTVEATVDGMEIQNLMDDYRFPSPIFSFHGATPGIFAPMYEGRRSVAFSDGWWVMLTPLHPGSHTIHFYGHLYIKEWKKYEFVTDTTYHLTVK